MEFHCPDNVALWAAGALTSGWPVLRCTAPDEVALTALLDRVVDVLGALPQAVIDEPWETEAPWFAWAELPELTAEDWVRLTVACPEVWLVPGLSPGAERAEAHGWAERERIECGDVQADQWIDRSGVGSAPPELTRLGGPDEAVQALERQLVEAIRTVDPALQPRSDRGPDTVAPVVARSSGRVGLWLSLGAESFANLAGDTIRPRRQAIIDALAKLILNRAEHDSLRLAPDLAWWSPLGGLDLVLWLITPTMPASPGNSAVQPGVDADVACTDAFPVAEIQLFPDTLGHHDTLVMSALAFAEEAGVDGGVCRWIPGETGWHFAATWQADAKVDTETFAEKLGTLPHAYAVRVVPGEPLGLEEHWPCANPVWRRGMGSWFLRVRDGRQDRDRLPTAGPRELDADDLAMGAVVMQAMLARGIQPLEPPIALDAPSGPALEWVLPSLNDPKALDDALQLLASVPKWSGILVYAQGVDRTRVRVLRSFESVFRTEKE